MELTTYPKRILLVEDSSVYYEPLTRWLSEEGYQVTLATSYKKALSTLDTLHFHLAIIDLRLKDDDPANEEGIELLTEIQERGLIDVMPCIILTAYPNVENILTAFHKRGVAGFVRKEGGYRNELLILIRHLFQHRVKINFDLIFEVDSEKLIAEIAEDVNWSMASKPEAVLLTPQIKDLFGKLFFDADSLFIQKLKPGLTGAAIVRAQAIWNHMLGRSFVAKVGRRDKVEIEADHFRKFVKPYLPNNTITQVDLQFTRHLGMLLYTFAENDRAPLKEFDDYYKTGSSEEIITSLQNLFQQTCGYWYAAPQQKFTDLSKLYYDAFQLDQYKLINRIQIVLPQFDPTQMVFSFDRQPIQALNPIAWLDKHREDCILPVYNCITHGDLTGRNIMVSDQGRCWLIDFYRTYKSHILRDFVILETDLKYRLLKQQDFKHFLSLELALIDTSSNSTSHLPPDLQKAAKVISAIRTLAYEFSSGRRRINYHNTYKEYLISLLMTTLNVVRLRHINEDRKLQAMLSAGLICAELDSLAGRETIRPSFGDIELETQALPIQPPVLVESSTSSANLQTTAQQRFLAEHLTKGKLVLFIGSSRPQGTTWPTIEVLAQQLIKEVDKNALPTDSPMKLFTVYDSVIGSRSHLINKHIEYFVEKPRPVFFDLIAKFNWSAIYTTNQHTYIEDAFKSAAVKFQEMTNIIQPINSSETLIPIYKLFGSLSPTQREAPPTILPITELDHQNSETKMRLNLFNQKLNQMLGNNCYLLMLCASKQEIEMLQNCCLSSRHDGLIWISNSDLSDDDQDFYRRLGFRVIPDHPAGLLTTFSRLVYH